MALAHEYSVPASMPRDEALGSQRRLWTRDEYYRLGELGFFEGQRVELIHGEIRVLSRESAPHYGSFKRVLQILEEIKPQGTNVREKAPLAIRDDLEPEPDLAIVAASIEQMEVSHPVTALLVMEIRRSSLTTDRGEKVPIYASAGIPLYLIVNLVHRQVEVFQDPCEIDGQPAYRVGTILRPGAKVKLFDHEIDVAHFFPARSS